MQSNDKKKCTIEYIPGKPVLRLSEVVYFYLVYLVPKGRLTQYNDVIEYLKTKFGDYHIELHRPLNVSWDYWCKFIDYVPFHRVVSSGGFIEPLNRDKLISEGFELEEVKKQNRGWKIVNHKKYLFDFEKETDVTLDYLKKINEQEDFEVSQN